MIITSDMILNISIILGISIFVMILCITLIIDDRKRRKTIEYDPNDWFFHNFNTKIYEALFFKKKLSLEENNNKANDIAKKLGCNLDDFYHNSTVSGIQGNLYSLIMTRIYSYLFLLSGICIMLFVSKFIGIILLLFGVLLMYFIPKQMEKQAKERRELIEDELPRFVDLLQTSIQIGMPIDQAIRKTAEKLNGEFSKELLLILEQSNITSKTWIVALQDLAKKYNVDSLDDFVLNISTAYTKGINIYNTIVQQAELIKKQHIQTLKQRAKRLDNMILFPIMIVLVMIGVMVLYPLMSQFDMYL